MTGSRKVLSLGIYCSLCYPTKLRTLPFTIGVGCVSFFQNCALAETRYNLEKRVPAFWHYLRNENRDTCCAYCSFAEHGCSALRVVERLVRVVAHYGINGDWSHFARQLITILSFNEVTNVENTFQNNSVPIQFLLQRASLGVLPSDTPLTRHRATVCPSHPILLMFIYIVVV